MDNPKKEALWAEITDAVKAGAQLEDVVFELVSKARHQRDQALQEIDSHRAFWRGGREELEQAKTDAAQDYNRAQRMLHRQIGRRKEDLQNARIREAIESPDIGDLGVQEFVERLRAAMKAD